MARTVSVTKENLLDAAINIVKTEGAEALTARRLAKEAGCSTQPIFRVYSGMEELCEEVFGIVIKIYSDYCAEFKSCSDVPFVDLGLAYIGFAGEYKELFRMLFVSDNRYGKSLYELLNGENGFVKAQMNKASQMGCKDGQFLFMKMWMFIHGSACMALTGDYDLDSEATKNLLEEAERAFI